MLNRFLAGKQEEKAGPKQRRPFLASECNDLNDADKWRQQILREIGKKVMEIQNAGLGEHRCVLCLFMDLATTPLRLHVWWLYPACTPLVITKEACQLWP